MYKKPEAKERYVGFPMKMNAYAYENLFIMQKDENAFILYFILGVMSQNHWTWGSLETTVVTLSKQLPIKTKESDNRKEIKRLLTVLDDKGWLKITFDEKSFEYDTLLTITMVDLDSPQVMDVVESDNYKHTGWLKVTQEMFDACKDNARHFRAMIYAEWRMFRGQENEGTYRISLDEWEKTMDISHATAVKLVKELDELNLVDKQRGAMYQDANGQSKRETNLYSVVSAEEREERKEESMEGQYSFAHQHNIDVDAQLGALEITDPRTQKTNIFKTGKKDYLTAYCWYVIHDTDCKATKERGLWRLGLIEKANHVAYKKLVQDGLSEKKRQDEKKRQKEQQSQVSVYSNNPGGHIDLSWDYEDDIA
jgi:predicted transcriptional regulator